MYLFTVAVSLEFEAKKEAQVVEVREGEGHRRDRRLRSMVMSSKEEGLMSVSRTFCVKIRDTN